MSYSKVSFKSTSERTYLAQEQRWFENFAENLPLVRNGASLFDAKDTCAGPVIVVGAGPSVEKFSHLDLLKKWKGHVIATDRQLVPLLERNIVPEYVVSVDSSPDVAAFYDNPLVNQWAMRFEGPRIRAVFVVFVNPEVPKKFKGETYWVVPIIDDIEPVTKPSVTRALGHMTGGKLVGNGYGNNGAFSWSLATLLGHDTVILVGIDFSYGPDVQPMQTVFWKGLLEKRGGNVQDTLKKDYRWETNPFGHKVLTDVLFDGYREALQTGVEYATAKTVNCSNYSILHGPRVHCLSLEEAIRKYSA